MKGPNSKFSYISSLPGIYVNLTRQQSSIWCCNCHFSDFFFNSRFQWQVYIVVEQMNWFIGWEIVYTMVDIWGALSSCRSQFHLLASWWSLHTPARRPWNCNCFNKRRTPLGERVYDWLRRIPRGEWLYLGCFKCDTLSKKKLRCQYNSLQGIYKPYPKEFFS